MIEILKILWGSLLQAFSGKLWKWLVGGIGSLIAVLLIGKNFFNQSLEKSILLGIGFFVILFLARFLLFFVNNLIIHAHYLMRETIYGDGIILLKESFSNIINLRKKDVITDPEFVSVMTSTCDNLKSFFDKKTKANCSVSIKVPLSGTVNESTQVQNLCRDSNSIERDTDLYKKINHTIIGNTAYQKILHNVLRGKKKNFYYINGNINSSHDYDNTSKEAYKNGVLPYNSELVYPITPQITDSEQNYHCLGFICIDCSKTYEFDAKYDVAIIESIADLVYDLICVRNSHKEKKDQENERAA